MTRRSTNPYQKVRESARILRHEIEHFTPEQEDTFERLYSDLDAFKAALSILERAGVIVPDETALKAKPRLAPK